MGYGRLCSDARGDFDDSYWSWATLRVKPGSALHQFLERLGTILGLLKESITDFTSMKEIERVSVPLRVGLLYFIYRRYQTSGLRLFVGIKTSKARGFRSSIWN